MLEMHGRRKLGTLLEEDHVEAPRISSSSGLRFTNQHMRLSLSGVYDDVLNISPRLSYHNPTICLERREHGSLSFLERALDHKLHSYASSITSNETRLQKPATELINEIADLELEVVQLERHLLTLYRRTFEHYLPISHTETGHASRSLIRCLTGPQVQDTKIHIAHQAAHAVDSHYLIVKTNASQAQEETEKTVLNHSQTEKNSSRNLSAESKSCASPKRSIENDMRRSFSGHRNHYSLADHLGTAIIDHVPDTHFRLSEDIIRCISAVYCKLANPSAQCLDPLASSTSSVSSSSTFSPQDPTDSWSPRCQDEEAESPCLYEPLKNKRSRYNSIVEIPKIGIDGDKFDYASKMLSSFRSLIRRLRTIDPRKMEHEEQLAFWINIHNALVMHAFLAYGLHKNHMKSSSSIMKAAYNVGGHSVNACVIQRAILGCQLHRPALSLRSLFTPAIKYLTGNSRHPYALDHPEPLVHFALCLGAYSDPSVRVYTAKGIHQELKLAKTEFIDANVSLQKETTITLPKILQYYANDASLEMFDLIEMVSDCMPEAQRRAIQRCLKRKGEKCVVWSSYKLDFRYLVHRDLAK